MNNQSEDEFLTLKQAAKLIGVHFETVRRWHLKEGLKTYKFKKTLRVRKSDLLEFLSRNK